MLGTGVVRRDVEHEADVARRRGTSQRRKPGITAEMRGDPVVVDRVVAVIGPRFEDRIEVDGVHAEVGQVVELSFDARKVAAEELDHGRCTRARRLVPGAPAGRVAAVGPGAVLDVVRWVAIREAVGEDLVEDAVGQPRRRVEPGNEPEVLAVRRSGTMEARSVEPERPVPRAYEESVPGRRHGEPDGDLPPAAGRPGSDLAQLRERLLAVRRRAQEDPIDRLVEPCPDPESDLVADPEPVRRTVPGRDDVPDRAVVVEGGERNPVGQPFTAPDVRPPTMYFCSE